MLGLFRKEKMWGRRPLKGCYDVVIIGAGVHGLATAYYLAKRGVRDIAVLDRSYMGGGGSARSTAIIRANYITRRESPSSAKASKCMRVSLGNWTSTCSLPRWGAWTWATPTQR